MLVCTLAQRGAILLYVGSCIPRPLIYSLYVQAWSVHPLADSFPVAANAPRFVTSHAQLRSWTILVTDDATTANCCIHGINSTSSLIRLARLTNMMPGGMLNIWIGSEATFINVGEKKRLPHCACRVGKEGTPNEDHRQAENREKANNKQQSLEAYAM